MKRCPRCERFCRWRRRRGELLSRCCNVAEIVFERHLIAVEVARVGVLPDGTTFMVALRTDRRVA